MNQIDLNKSLENLLIMVGKLGLIDELYKNDLLLNDKLL